MYAIVGATGFLGSYMLKYILEKTDEQVLATSRDVSSARLDRSNERVRWISLNVQSQSSIDRFAAEAKDCSKMKVIYLAAYHHPEKVERYRSLAWDINVTALSRFLNTIPFIDSFYYISTDCVYGNSIDNYHFRENDRLAPVNFYGHCKCAAEAVTVHLGRNVVRLPFLISPSVTSKKHFYDHIVDELRQGRPVEMYSDSFRSSLGFDQVAKLVVQLIEKNNVHPIVNIGGDEDLSKYDVGLRVAEREGLDQSLIVPVLAERSEQWTKVERANSTLMDNSLLKEILQIKRLTLFD